MANLLLFAVDEGGGFGLGGDLPWGRTVKADLRRFKNLTMGRIVFAGRKTIETLPHLKGRMVGKVTCSPCDHMDFGLDEALAFETKPQVDKYFIGGTQIIHALQPKVADVRLAFVSIIHGHHAHDTNLNLDTWRKAGDWQLHHQSDTSAGVTFREYAR